MALDDCARTWRVATSTSERINKLASTLECYPSDLVDLLLTRALDAVERDQWPIERRPYKFTLHWGEGDAKGTQRGYKRE